MREKIEVFKKLWSIPKYKAIIKTLLYIIILLILYVIMQIMIIFAGNNEKLNNEIKIKEEVKLTPLENYKNMKNYEYTYEINYIFNKENINKTIEGTKYNDKDKFKILNDKYSIIDDKIYDKDNNIVSNLIEYDIISLLPNNLVDKFVGEKVETKYKDGKIKEEYPNAIVYIEDNYINKIELDLTDEVNKINNKITYYHITINYLNIDNIDSFN